MAHPVFPSPHTKNQKQLLRAPLVKLTLWAEAGVKTELQRIAEQEHLSLSKVGAAGLKAWVHWKLHDQNDALLYPMLRQVMREELRAFGNRLVFFLMRIAFAAEQSRILITNVLDRILRRDGVTEQTFTTLVDQSNTMARRNIIHKSPQLQSLLEEWEDTVGREEENGKPTD